MVNSVALRSDCADDLLSHMSVDPSVRVGNIHAIILMQDTACGRQV